ncbi:hypothetical protein E6C27_scaffold102G00090 [Cucumis melo var. makuwa]|uniref:Uncharacterized protein n=1 Tax=Cucumis melo var. makuwa TaxID=1194695 RepID=A0A5A7UHR6_CUCMM|nr:hypothetical protein E6C27_scaffold102G00090 [Cucumis melo var. makuwa]
MACSFFLDESYCPKTPPLKLSNTVKYRINGCPGTGEAKLSPHMACHGSFFVARQLFSTFTFTGGPIRLHSPKKVVIPKDTRAGEGKGRGKLVSDREGSVTCHMGTQFCFRVSTFCF